MERAIVQGNLEVEQWEAAERALFLHDLEALFDRRDELLRDVSTGDVGLEDETLARLGAWAEEADPIISDIRACEARRGELDLIGELVEWAPRGIPSM